jgi:hypothetical protein
MGSRPNADATERGSVGGERRPARSSASSPSMERPREPGCPWGDQRPASRRSPRAPRRLMRCSREPAGPWGVLEVGERVALHQRGQRSATRFLSPDRSPRARWAVARTVCPGSTSAAVAISAGWLRARCGRCREIPLECARDVVVRRAAIRLWLRTAPWGFLENRAPWGFL